MKLFKSRLKVKTDKSHIPSPDPLSPLSDQDHFYQDMLEHCAAPSSSPASPISKTTEKRSSFKLTERPLSWPFRRALQPNDNSENITTADSDIEMENDDNVVIGQDDVQQTLEDNVIFNKDINTVGVDSLKRRQLHTRVNNINKKLMELQERRHSFKARNNP